MGIGVPFILQKMREGTIFSKKGRPEIPLEKTREIDNEAKISKKAEMKRKFNRNQKRITP